MSMSSAQACASYVQSTAQSVSVTILWLHMLKDRGPGKAPSVAAFLPLLDLGQSLSRIVLAREARRRVDRRGQCCAGALFVSSFQGRQAEMVLDDGLVGQFRRAVLEQVRGSLIHTALVENPAQRVRDVRVVGHRFLGALG